MRVPRLHLPGPWPEAGRIGLDADASGHLHRVLRLRRGALVRVFDAGRERSATLLSDRPPAELELGEWLVAMPPPRLAITLLQALCRGDKMDLVLQKAVELGVGAVCPVATEHAGVHLDATRAGRRLQHWQQIVRHACGQCGRAELPPVWPLQPLADALAQLPMSDGNGTLRLFLDPEAETTLSQLPTPAALVLAIGPEGGFGVADLRQLAAAGFTGLTLGPRILRTETAGLAALAALQARFGDLG